MLPLDLPGWVEALPVSVRPEPLGAGLAGGVVAVRLGDLAVVDGVAGPVLVARTGDRSLMSGLADGELVAWCQVTAVAPVVFDRDGRLAAEGWLPDHVRLGVLEEHLGAGVVEQVIAQTQTASQAAARAQAPADDDVAPGTADADNADGPGPGNGKQRRQRVMSLELVARLVLAMTLMPQASYVEALAQLVGLLPRLPWVRAWQVPSSTVITAWRRLLGVDAMKAIFDRVAGHIVAATDPGARWHGLRVCALDGCQIRLPDTDENRAAFGSSGTTDDGADSPFPLARAVLGTARAGRAMLAAELDASWVGEQTLAHRLITEHPDLFTDECLYLVDRNFLSWAFVQAVHRGGHGAHLVARAKDGLKLPIVQRFGDGDYLSYLRSPDRRSRQTVRVVEYDLTQPDGTVSEVFCLVTTLLDPDRHPAADIRDLYPQRWSASESTIGENKSTITAAGPSCGPILRSTRPDLVRQEFWAWLAATQLVRRTAYAATKTTTGVGTDQISFTTTRREATRSMTQSLVTATTAPAALADTADRTARSILSTLITIQRDRHSAREQKYRPGFRHTSWTKTTTRGPLRINVGIPTADPT